MTLWEEVWHWRWALRFQKSTPGSSLSVSLCLISISQLSTEFMILLVWKHIYFLPVFALKD